MSYDTEVLADTPQIYWKLQDASGTSAVDSSGNTRPGTYNGTAGTNYALADSTNLVSSDPTMKSVKLMRDSAVEGGHPTTRANLADASTVCGKATISRAYEAWMNVSGAAFSVESWFKIPATLNRYGPYAGMYLAARSSVSPLQWALGVSSFSADPFMSRFETVVSSAMGQQVYVARGSIGRESVTEAVLGGDYEQTIENAGSTYTGYGDLVDGAPHHLIGACGANSVKTYLDGMLGSVYFNSGVPAIPTQTTQPVTFGGLNASSTNYGFLGWMSHCAHYPSELLAARAAAHFTAGGTKVTFLNQQWALLAATEMLLSESVTTSSALTAIQRQLIALADMTTFTADMTAIARQAIALAESVTVAPSFTPQQVFAVAFLDSVSITQQITVSRFAQMLLTSLMTVNDVLSPTSRSTMSLSDIITSAIAVRVDGQELVGWVINPNLQASTMLSNYDFLGFGEHRGRYYGLKRDGLYVLDGATDGGAAINSFISLGNRNFGTSIKKRVPYAYIGAASTGAMVLKVIADGQTFLYQVRNPTTDMAEQRVDIGRGLRASYWNFELMNQNGEDFNIDTIKFLPIVLERRI